MTKRKVGAVAAAAVVVLIAGTVIHAITNQPKVTNLVTLHCGVSHFNQVDPIVAPGIKPSAHEHTFYGNRGTDQFSTPDSLVGGQTTCQTAGDTGAYWVPTLFVDGTRVASKNLHIGEYWFANNAPAEPPPFGMEFVAGNSKATDPSQETAVRWHCKGGFQQGDGSAPVACTTAQGPLKYETFFPQCWTGTGTDRTNFAYATDGLQGHICPAGFPHHIAQLGLQVDLLDASGKQLYDPFAADGSIRVSLASGPWYTAHADFLNSWDEAALSAIVNGCMDHTETCPAHA